MAKPSSLGYVDLILTAGCNLTCSYCYQNAKQHGRNMDAATVEKGVDLLLSSPRPELKLGLYGGEPLIRFDMVRHAIEYAERRRPGGKPVRYAIITNGTLLDDDKAEFLARHDVETRISFDGVPAAQDERGAGTFRVLDGLLDRLRARHRLWFEESVQISTTVTPRTFSHLAESIVYFLGKDVRTILFSPQITDTSGWKLESIDELRAQFERIFEASLALWEETGIVPVVDFRHGDTADDVHMPRGRAMCGAPNGEVVAVDVDGAAYGCVMFAQSFQKLGSPFLRDQVAPLGLGPLAAPGFSDKLKLYPSSARSSSMFHKKQNKYSSYRKCGDCEFLSECSICPVSIGNIPGNADPDRIPDFMCAWNLVVRECGRRFPAQPTAFDFLVGTERLPGLMRELESFATRSRRPEPRRVS
jgi:sulfatase maturation enzyme AslB (radical SAM superfamily)